MKRYIRLVTLILVAITLLYTTFVPTKAIEETGAIPTFEQYKADHYINFSLYEYVMSDEFKLPYRTVVEKNCSNNVYMSIITAWELATFEPSNLVELSKKKLGYYEAFLFDILYQGYEPTNVTKELNGIVKATEASMVKKVSKFFKDDFYLQTPINDMNEEKYETLQKALQECEEIQDVMGAIGNISKVLKYASNVEELIYKLAKIQAIGKLTDENADVLEKIAASTKDASLSAACLEMAAICRNQLTETQIIVMMSSDMVGTELAKYALNEIWGELVKKISGEYGLAIQVGQSVGKWASGLLFSADKEVENFYEMCALYTFEDEMRKAVAYYANNYKTFGSTEDAMLFNTSFELLLKTLSLACDITVEHFKIVNGADESGGVVRLFYSTVSGDYDKFLQLKESFNNVKKQLNFTITFAQENLYNLYRELYCEDIADEINMPAKEGGATEEEIIILIEELQTNIFFSRDVVISSDLQLTHDMETCEDLYLSGGTLDLNGHTLTVNGNLYHSDGTMLINGGILEVGGDYRIQRMTQNEEEIEYTFSRGCLIMQNENDKVRIKGSFYTQNEYSSGLAENKNIFTAGVMEIGGNFQQLRAQDNVYWGKDNFDASGTHKVVLNGTGKQEVYFESPGGFYESSSSGFNDLELVNTNVEFNSAIRGWVLQRDTVFGNGMEMGMTGTFDLNGHTLTVDGNLYQNSMETIDLNGGMLIVNGDLCQENATMLINGGALEIMGDYRIQEMEQNDDGEIVYTGSPSCLIMQNKNDKVRVKGSFYNQNRDESNSDTVNILTAGVMEIGGDFQQLMHYGYSGHGNFDASGTHKVVLNGTGKQKVYFASTVSGFNDLELVNKDVDFTSEIRGWKFQRDFVFEDGLKMGGGIFDLNGHTLTVNGNLYQSGGTMLINGGILDVTGDYRIQRMEQNEEGKLVYTHTNGLLIMQNENDRVKIKGSFYNQSCTSYSLIIKQKNIFTAGVMEIGGDFQQLEGRDGAYWENSFDASGTHKVVLNGTGKQEVYFGSPRGSGFNDLELVNKNVEFTSAVRGWALQRNTLFENGMEMGMTGTFDLNGHTLTVNGNFYQSGGTMLINGGVLNVTGDYRIQRMKQNDGGKVVYTESYGYLIMQNENDKVRIKGSFYNQESGEDNIFTAGLMEIGGNFQQLVTDTNYGKKNFNASGTHKVILNGTEKQKVTFSSYPYSHFNILQLTQDRSQYVFSTEPCWNTLCEAGSDVNVAVTSVKLSSNSLTLISGQQHLLTAMINPVDATDKSVYWSSADTSIATVDEKGLVTGIKVGSVSITATAKDGSGKSASCTVTVEEAEDRLDVAVSDAVEVSSGLADERLEAATPEEKIQTVSDILGKIGTICEEKNLSEIGLVLADKAIGQIERFMPVEERIKDLLETTVQVILKDETQNIVLPTVKNALLSVPAGENAVIKVSTMEPPSLEEIDMQKAMAITLELYNSVDEKIQLRVPVVVSIPIPDVVDVDKEIVIYHFRSDLAKYSEKIHVKVDRENNMLTFVTGSFSTFVIANVRESQEPIGVSVGGIVKSFGDASTKVILRLLDSNSDVVAEMNVTGNNAVFAFGHIKEGIYTLEVGKEKHITRKYNIVVSDEDIVQDAVLWLLGDINGNGTITADDLTVLAQHIGGLEGISDEGLRYAAEIDGDKDITANDLTVLARYVGGLAEIN